ncbi:MAG: hypothetical protein EHM78_24465 [Myxococcaceae bacterium]|nr:MAG: hypothetical protein EHM78_24465 [Myxococcaceae bacterium]
MLRCASTLLLFGALLLVGCAAAPGPSSTDAGLARVVYVTHSGGYRHDCLPTSAQVTNPWGHPLAWVRMHGQGRVLYCALGHESSTWEDGRFQALLRDAVGWLLRRR